ncbi:hypothetical protein GP486_005035 [Trichoglossum hirsutum]|uniref:Uncharacterized protein n=1 Tax=Trichoglossum hirsutum TaxID=265104 RepID=A0A9P8RNH2_9PEZI|nr:hypothetical protein GP486_005035 [Trichoglossum hirsutum]
MASPIGRYRPPYPTREELLGLTAQKRPDPPPMAQAYPVSRPAGQDSQQSRSDSPPAPPQKDDVRPLPRKDSLTPAGWNENGSSAKAPEAAGTHKDPTTTSVWSKTSNLAEEIRQRRSEKKLKPVGPPNLSLGESNNNDTTIVRGNTPPKVDTERPLPSLPSQPTLEQLPPRNANLPGRQVKPLKELPKEPLQTPQTGPMGSSKSKPVRPENSTSMPRRPLLGNTLPRASQPDSEEARPGPATPYRGDSPPKAEGNDMRPAEPMQRLPDVARPKAPPPPVDDVPLPIAKASTKTSAPEAEARVAPSYGTQRPQPAESRLPPPAMPPQRPIESYTTEISDIKSFAGRLRQIPQDENRGLPGTGDAEEYEDDKLAIAPSPSNYTDNSASVSPLKDSNDSITPPSSYPDEDDRPLTPLNAPPANKAIIWNLNTVQYRCYIEHRNMKLSRNERHPMPCMLCNVADQEPRRKCTWCCLRICKDCHWLLTETCQKSVESLVDMLSKEGKTGAEIRGKMEQAPKMEAQSSR